MSLSYAQKYKKMIELGTFSVQEIQDSAKRYFDEVGRGRGVGYKSYKRWENLALIMMDENGMLKSSEFYYNEIESFNQEQNLLAYRPTSQGSWQQLGPTTWDDSNSNGWNPGVGRITSIGIEQFNQNHIIVGSPGGGVWKTTDGGVNWTVLTDNFSNIDVYALTIDPSVSSTYYWGSTSGIIYKSIDGGATWNLLADTGYGTINKILIHPTDSSKMFCSSSAGIFKSTDSGVTWSLIHSGATSGYDIEFKPGDTNTIYASGENFYKSTDGGVTFSTPDIFSQWTQEYVSGVNDWSVVSQNQNNTITPKTGASMAQFYKNDFNDDSTRLISFPINLAGATNSVLKFSYANVNWGGDVDEIRVLYKNSVNGSWNELAAYTTESTTWTDITLNLPNVSSDYYIAFEGLSNWGRGANLDDISVETFNSGVVFQEGFELSESSFSSGSKMMGVSPDDPNVLYVLEESSSTFGAFYKSTDSGDSFIKLDHADKNYFGYATDADDDRGQAPRDMDVAVNPNDADEVHIAGILTWRSIDGGSNFSITSQWVPGNAAGLNIGYCHADVDILEFVGTNLYAGTDGGIFIAENTNTVNSNYYRDLTNGLGIRQFYRIGISQSNPVVVTGGSQDNGSSVYINGAWKDWLGADGMEGFVDKDNVNTLYGTSQNGSLYKSTNGGTTYSGLSEPEGKSGNWITPFEQDPSITNTIYSGYDKVYRSTNSGVTWTAISQDFGDNLNHLKIAHSDNQIMFAAEGNNLYKTIDGGATNWLTKTGFSGYINSIAIHPTDPNKIALATTGSAKVYVSVDGGDTWSTYLYNLPDFSAFAVAWHDNGNDGLYVGMNYGVFYIDDTFPGEWQPFSNNLPNVKISELEVNLVDEKLYAGTYGRGLWSSDLYNPLLLNLPDDTFVNLEIFPNPVVTDMYLRWDKNEPVTIKLYDARGKLLFYEKEKVLNEPYRIDTSNLSSGLYFIKINTIQGNITKKLIVN
jgi:photosystem II stability/assembly factor-like uncharacterized protein